MQHYGLAFVVLWLWRYFRLFVHLIAAWTLKPIRPDRNPEYDAGDVMVVLPTFGKDNSDLRRCLRSINTCQPRAVDIVSPEPEIVKSICRDLDLDHFEVLGAPKPNKRLQMIQGIEHVKTPIIVFADDDVFWPKTFLTHLLAPFEDSCVGAVGAFASLARPERMNVWDFLGATYLERWNFGVAATFHVDGGIACLSGRTSAVRSSILHDNGFNAHFAKEKWFFNIPLSKADDDNCITRWLVNHGWKIAIQNAPEAGFTTTLDSSPTFLGQCLRWDRTTWRSNTTSMFYDRYIWTAQPWCSYALHLSTFNPPAAVMEGVLAYFLHHTYDNSQPTFFLPSTRETAFTIFITWIIIARTIKLWPYFYQHPSDLKFLPVLFVFAYFHGLIRIWSFLTLFHSSWDGSHMSLANPTDKATNLAADAQLTGSKSFTNMRATLVESAKGNTSMLRQSGYERTLHRLSSGTDLKRLGMRADSTG
ncbi:MAG: hypothetical protein Q9182_001241 [Xanthomendoza sp. 2 TL-2023]